MAIRFIDSFDHYTANADLLTKWTKRNLQGGTSSASVSAGNGRGGTACMRISGAGGEYAAVTKVLDSQGTWVIGFWFKPGIIGAYLICSLYDAGSYQIDFRMAADGTLRFTKNGTLVGVASTYTLSAGVGHYIEVKFVISNSAGAVYCKVDGVTVIDTAVANLNTRTTSNSTANEISIGNYNLVSLPSGTNFDYDDLYICDGNSPNNDFLGDIGNSALFPSGSGASSQWSRGGADSGNNWDQVNETAPNTTDYVTDGTSGHRDTYAIQDLSATTGTIKAVTLLAYARKDDAGARSIKFVAYIGGSPYYSDPIPLSTSFSYYSYSWSLSPATGLAWTVTEVNNAEFGYEVV